MTNYVIGIDVGTQGTKSALFDENGNKAAECFEASGLICPGPGIAEQDPEELYGSVLRTIRGVMGMSKISPSQVAGIGIDAQMAGIIAVDHHLQAIGAYDSWLDMRCEPMIEKMKLTAQAEIIRSTGGQVTYSHGPKILYRRKETPAEYDKTAKFLTLSAYLTGRMCSLRAEEAFIDYTHLHFTGFADNKKLEWNHGLLQEFGIHGEKLPRICAPYEMIGGISKEAAASCGLLAGTAVIAGSGDSAASAFGAGITEENMIYDVAGTASIFSCSTKTYSPDVKDKTLLFARSVILGMWTPLAYIGGGGLCVKWHRDQSGRSFEELNQGIASIEPGSRGLFFVPHLAGMTCPNDSKVKGGFLGLSFYHTAEHMYRSILESIAYEYAGYFSILKNGIPQLRPNAVYGAGGGTKSSIFNQIKADVLNMPYYPLENADTASYGAAVLAGYGTGIFESPQQGVQLKKRNQCYKPCSGSVEQYKIFTEQYQRLVREIAHISSNIWN